MFLHGMAAFCDISDNSITNYEGRACFHSLYQVSPASEFFEFVDSSNAMTSQNDSYQQYETDDGNTTEKIIEGLKPYTLYVFYLSVCNQNITEREQCSGYVTSWARTATLESADDIKHVSVQVKESAVVLKWKEPDFPNSLLLAYTIEHKRIDLDHSLNVRECITRQDYLRRERSFVLSNLVPGEYVVRVQATSLPGKGRFSPYTR